jgi:hypothetical protein
MQFRRTMIILFAALLLVLALAACSGQATETPAETTDGAAAAPAAESEAEPTAPAPTAVPAANEEEEASAVSMNGPDGCMAFSAIPTPNPTLEALFPPPNADDHVKGPAEASVTIMEYSDFQ